MRVSHAGNCSSELFLSTELERLFRCDAGSCWLWLYTRYPLTHLPPPPLPPLFRPNTRPYSTMRSSPSRSTPPPPIPTPRRHLTPSPTPPSRTPPTPSLTREGCPREDDILKPRQLIQRQLPMLHRPNLIPILRCNDDRLRQLSQPIHCTLH